MLPGSAVIALNIAATNHLYHHDTNELQDPQVKLKAEMDEDTATRFVSSLVKSIQALCNGYIDFTSSIEVIGHIHLNIDRSVKFNYVLTEEVSKSVSEGATLFASHSYHSQPPPSVATKQSSDGPRPNRRKSHQVPRVDDSDPLGIVTILPDMSSVEPDNSFGLSRFGDGSDSSHSEKFSATGDSSPSVNIKPEKQQPAATHLLDSLDRRGKKKNSRKTPSPAAKRSRNNDGSSTPVMQNPELDVIEIKEEPEEPPVCFGDGSSHAAAGQDIQTPDFSNVVMESLDRVGQIEGSQLVADGDPVQQQQQPFPVMLHANPSIPTPVVPVTAVSAQVPPTDVQATPSTSGGLGVWGEKAAAKTSKRPKVPLISKEKCRKFREKLQCDPVRWATYKAEMAERSRQQRQTMTPQQKEVVQQQGKKRQQNWRDRQRQLKAASPAEPSRHVTKRNTGRVTKRNMLKERERHERNRLAQAK